MAIDHYAPCPCGNGKKIKFCKCVDQPQEFEKLLKLIEGGQGVAAIDRINQLLKKTPNAAWLLAIKGELTLSMQEMDSFRETAVRFLKLKPDNPLALVMRSIVASIDREPPENAARYLLEGMSESRESMPALTVSAIRILLDHLDSSNKLCLVGFWGEVLTALTANEGPSDDSVMVDPNINLLAKAPARIVDDPKDAAWQERLTEVFSLVKIFRYAQAETKLRAILRDFPDQPGPLSHLLRAQCAQLDQAGAFATAEKLAGIQSLTEEERSYFKALSLELQPGQPALEIPTKIVFAEIETEDSIVEILSADKCVESQTGEAFEQMRRYYAALIGDEVPAKHLFTVFNQDLSEQPENTEERKVASAVGTFVMFGKQTDHPARILLLAHSHPSCDQQIEDLLERLPFAKELDAPELPFGSTYAEFLRRGRIIVRQPNTSVSAEELGAVIVDEYLNTPFSVLDNRSVLDVKDEDEFKPLVGGLLFHLEGEQSLVVPKTAIDEIYQQLGISRPAAEVEPEGEALRLLTVLHMDRLEIDQLNDRQLKGLAVRVMALGATRVFFHAANAIRARESMADDTQIQIAALSGLLTLTPSIDERLALCETMEGYLTKAGAPVGKVVIQRMSLLHAAGRPDEARQVLMEGAQKYPEDPYLMSFIQYAMQSQGGPPPGGGGGDDLAMKMMQNASQAKAAQSESGLVLPGQEGGGSDGESKLWLPGS